MQPALAELAGRGLWLGIAGNQTVRAATLLRSLGLPVHAVATSGEWGVAKPHSDFFAKVVALAPGEPSEIVYVGDHRDNDLIPAHAAGMRTALIRRGPWGYLWADDPTVVKTADWIINTLSELPDLLRPTGQRS